MQVTSITLEEFQKEAKQVPKHVRKSVVRNLLRQAESDCLCITFDSLRQATTKVTQLYHLRKLTQARVIIRQRNEQIYLGPKALCHVPDWRRVR